MSWRPTVNGSDCFQRQYAKMQYCCLQSTGSQALSCLDALMGDIDILFERKEMSHEEWAYLKGRAYDQFASMARSGQYFDQSFNILS